MKKNLRKKMVKRGFTYKINYNGEKEFLVLQNNIGNKHSRTTIGVILIKEGNKIAIGDLLTVDKKRFISFKPLRKFSNEALERVAVKLAEFKIEDAKIHYVDFGRRVGSEQGGLRPAIILRDKGNGVVVAPITSVKATLPTHVALPKGLKVFGTILLEQLTTVSKEKVKNYKDKGFSNIQKYFIENAIAESLGI